MTPPRISSPLALAGLLIVAAATLGGLMLGVAGDRKGMQALPDSAGSTVEVLPDPVANFTLEQAVQKPESAWQRWDGQGYVQSFFGEAVWVRITLRNREAMPRRGVLADAEYYTDRIDLWVPDAGAPATWRHERAGEWVPAREKSLWGRDAAFMVDVPPRGERLVYLRLQDYFGVWLRPVWWPDARAFFAAQLRDTVAETCYFGILLALLVYNGVLWARLRFRDIGYYCGYLAAGAGFMFMARAQHQVVGWPAGSPIMETPLTCALALSGFFLVQFARTFLEMDARSPWALRAARVMSIFNLIGALGALAIPWMIGTIWLHFAVGGVAVTHAVMLAAAIAAWRAGSYHARFFVLSFGLLLAGMLPTAIIWLLSIPLGMSSMAMMLGSALEMLLLSIAVADRFARLQQEKLEAQQRAVKEAEERRVIQEAYADELEHEVRERTRELVTANSDKDRMMAVLGHDLRSPLTSLTLAAEQHAAAAAAPEARAGFAAEAAQMGRALLLLLEDVVLWSRLRAGSTKTADHPAESVVMQAAELHRAVAARRGVEVLVGTAPGLRVRADLVLAQTLVRNLVSNAVKAARSQVTVMAMDNGDRVRVTVSDDGPGLPAAVAARLRDWPAREQPGSASAHPWGGRGGLGLQLCVETAQAMGTKLEAGEAPQGGAEIWFTLPKAKK